MKKVNYRLKIIEQSPEPPLSCERQRQTVIKNIAEKALEKCADEEKAIGLFLWKSKGPVDQDELMLFHAYYMMYQSSRNVNVESREEALEILGAPSELLDLAEDDLYKDVKHLYWKKFNELSWDLRGLIKNASEMGRKKCAFEYFSESL